ncbi:hypothetical protein P7K49_011877 [Saguinus oedipus]|uniref:Matrix-remodeling-associated protein 7 n=1 Tax=Saguinus oedipus TaxID=9490 RepID=A0ABQ9VRX3_SAGOE|nr:hypothetical protein P7K49_011877 [Saguinus oedipus]
MEAPAELLAALPALATALALLLAWLLVRRGAAASPEPAPPAEATEAPALSSPYAPESAAAPAEPEEPGEPAGPGELAGPGEPDEPGKPTAAPAEAEEQTAESRQVRTGAPAAPSPPPGLLLLLLLLLMPAEPGSGAASLQARLPQENAEPAAHRKCGSRRAKPQRRKLTALPQKVWRGASLKEFVGASRSPLPSPPPAQGVLRGCWLPGLRTWNFAPHPPLTPPAHQFSNPRACGLFRGLP